MKILYVTTISDTVNSFLIPHIKYLIANGNEVGVAFNTVQAVSSELVQAGCRVYQVTFQRNPFNRDNLIAYKEIKKILKEDGYDLVHVHTPVASFITRLACRRIKIKVLYTAHGFHFFEGAPKKNWAVYYTLERLVAKWTDGIITMNDEDFHAAKRLKLRKRNSIYKVNGVGLDLSKFLPQTPERKKKLRQIYGYRDEDFILIYAGELSFRKNQDLLIEAISMIKSQVPNIKLLLAGDGSLLETYRNLAVKLDVQAHVEFLGQRDDIANLMAISDIAISSSRQEGLPVNVMEAMATGLPLIVTNCRGNRDLVKSGQNGIVIGIGDTKACASAILELFYSTELRQAYAENNTQLIKMYSLDTVINDMKDIYFKQSLNS